MGWPRGVWVGPGCPSTSRWLGCREHLDGWDKSLCTCGSSTPKQQQPVTVIRTPCRHCPPRPRHAGRSASTSPAPCTHTIPPPARWSAESADRQEPARPYKADVHSCLWWTNTLISSSGPPRRISKGSTMTSESPRIDLRSPGLHMCFGLLLLEICPPCVPANASSCSTPPCRLPDFFLV